MLFQNSRHTPLKTIAWSSDKARATAADIYYSTLRNFEPERGWKKHPDEDMSVEYGQCLYTGAAGTLWALRRIEKALGLNADLNYAALIEKVHTRYLHTPDTVSVVPSFLLGETGILLLKYLWTKDARILDRLEATVDSNILNPINETLWAAPGTMVAPLVLFQKTEDPKWKALFLKNCDYLFKTWNYKVGDTVVWEQDLYGKLRRMIGAGHGFVGNVAPMLEGIDLLDDDRRTLLLDRTVQVLATHAKIEGECANWAPLFDAESERGMLVQWCHGAPGVITSLRNLPKGYSPELEKLLVMAGETTWQAGALNKGVGICHSTDGNGWAFLTLYKRTGDAKWLERARAFAMHAITQRNGRFTLWTGEPGLALYLLACIAGDDRIPSVNDFADA